MDVERIKEKKMTCYICNKDPGTKKGNLVWKGFLDQDTGYHVCFNCQQSHYKNKSKTELRNLYSEIPVIINN